MEMISVLGIRKKMMSPVSIHRETDHIVSCSVDPWWPLTAVVPVGPVGPVDPNAMLAHTAVLFPSTCRGDCLWEACASESLDWLTFKAQKSTDWLVIS